MILERIRDELREAHPADLAAIREYVVWLRFRQHANETFRPYPRSHWDRPHQTSIGQPIATRYTDRIKTGWAHAETWKAKRNLT